MSDYWQRVIGRQFVAAVEMLQDSIEACPEELWDDRTDGTPFWHLAYHVLFYCDFYLSESEQAFEPRDFHVDQYHFLPGDYSGFKDFGIITSPKDCLGKLDLLVYAGHCIEKSKAAFAELTEKRAKERCGFWWYELNVGEFLINNLRHVQHHTAQLALILRRRADIGVDWMGTEGNQPAPPTW